MLTVLIVCLALLGCESASLGDEAVLLPEETDVVPEEVMAEPKFAELEEEQFEPVDDNFGSDAMQDENCDLPEVVDEKSADRAERKADEDLLEALDSMLARNESIQDAIASEYSPID